MTRRQFLLPAALIIMLGCASRSSPVRIGDIDMAYQVHGNGPALVMIMGFNGTMDLWEPNVIRLLSDHFKVIVFDNRGMGGTTAGHREFSIEQFADETAGLLDALGVGRAHVLGWSMGTEVALELTLRHPDKVDKLVLCAGDCSMQAFPPTPDVLEKLYDTSSTPGESGAKRLGLMFPPDWLKERGAYIKEIFSRHSSSSSPESIRRQAAAMNTWKGCCDRLPQIKAATLLLTGTEDVLTPPQNSYMLAEKLPKARLVTFENAGHGVFYQYPERFAQTVIGFLEGISEK
ncbi:MAG: alpha/beta hydrolase [Candidatus Aminicenantes bacterium]|nr:alpha/beta hydrolase [Candidatus Aminicenantes bacterium]